MNRARKRRIQAPKPPDFSPGTNYYATFRAAVSELYDYAHRRDLSAVERMVAADALIEKYVTQTGERPPGGQLDRLATLILEKDAEERAARERAERIKRLRREAGVA